MFQIDRLDGSSAQLHFHKSGSMDPPTVIGSAPPPALRADPEAPCIGRHEAHIAFLHFLGNDSVAKAMEVTYESAFQWPRHLVNQWHGREIEAPGIVKVWVARLQHGVELCDCSKG